MFLLFLTVGVYGGGAPPPRGPPGGVHPNVRGGLISPELAAARAARARDEGFEPGDAGRRLADKEDCETDNETK